MEDAVTLDEIRKKPTSVSREFAETVFSTGCVGIHESCLRSHGIVKKLIELIEKQTPHAVLLEIIDDLLHHTDNEKETK